MKKNFWSWLLHDKKRRKNSIWRGRCYWNNKDKSSFWKQDRAAVCIRSYRIKCKLQGACAEKTDNNDNLFYDVFDYAGLLFAIISCG